MVSENENSGSDGSEEVIIEAEIVEEEENTNLTVPTPTNGGKLLKLRRWTLRLALGLAVLGIGVYLFAALGYRMGVIELGTALGTLSRDVGPFVFIAALIVSVISILLSWFLIPRRGILLSLIAFAIPLGGLLKGVSVGQTVDRLPFIHDITTDSEDPPRFSQAIIDARASTNASNTLEYFEKKDKRDGKLVSVLQFESYPDIVPVRRNDSPSVVYGEAKKLIGSKGWDVVTEDEENWILEATETTFWYGFKDDIVIRIRPSKNGGSIIDMRSVSRIGESDLGVNAERLRKLISELKGD